MNIEKYQELTGKTLTDAEKTLVKAQIKRSLRILEGILGFTLETSKINKNIYNELGKAQDNLFWSYPNVDISNLLPPDEVVGAYRLYGFKDEDKYFHVDPFTSVYAVKLVYVKQGFAEDSGITFYTFEDDEVRPQYGRDGIGKYIERVKVLCYEYGIPIDHVQLAVDADWAWQKCLPDEILWMVVDMVEEYIDPKSKIRSESIEGHSYSKYDKVAPEAEASNAAFLRKYAGPHGTAVKVPTL